MEIQVDIDDQDIVDAVVNSRNFDKAIANCIDYDKINEDAKEGLVEFLTEDSDFTDHIKNIIDEHKENIFDSEDDVVVFLQENEGFTDHIKQIVGETKQEMEEFIETDVFSDAITRTLTEFFREYKLDMASRITELEHKLNKYEEKKGWISYLFG